MLFTLISTTLTLDLGVITIELGPNFANVLLVLIAAIPSFIAAYYAQQSSKHSKESTITSNRTNDTINTFVGNGHADTIGNDSNGNPVAADDSAVQSST